MPRPRKFSDADVFAAAHRAMSRLGPGELRLADIAGEAGVTPSALVQRFGSKRNLLLALSRAWSVSARDFFAELGSTHDGPLDTLRAYAACVADMARSPAAFARSLAYLQIDLTDDDFRETLATYAHGVREEITRLIAEAVDAGELTPDVDAARLARTVEAVLSGSLITWAYERREGPRAWMLGDLEAVLEPYRTGRAASRPAND